MGYKIFKFFGLILIKILFRVRYEGKENIPTEDGIIFASNHRSYWDPAFIAFGLKKPCVYMAKEELFKNPVFAAIIRILGAFPVARGKGDTDVIDQTVEKVKSGNNLVIFPEGTRSKTGKVGAGKTGVALIAARANTTVIPVGIVYDGKIKVGKKVIVKYGKPISADELKISQNPVPKELKQLKFTIMGAITELVEK